MKLQPNLSEVGKGLEEYGEAFSGLSWLPLAGPWIERGRVATMNCSNPSKSISEGGEQDQ